MRILAWILKEREIDSIIYLSILQYVVFSLKQTDWAESVCMSVWSVRGSSEI